MSCHDIGRGLNMVTKNVMELYDEGKLGFEDVKKLLFTIEKGVHQCDGNEYEAVAWLYGHWCGKCLKSTEDLYDLYEIPLVPCTFDEEEYGLNTSVVCMDCFEEFCKANDIVCDDNLLKKMQGGCAPLRHMELEEMTD